MNDFTVNAFREAARKLTGLRVNDGEADPNELAVDLANGFHGSVSSFEIEIGSVALLYELREAGVVVDAGELAAFVGKDIIENSNVAMTAYLGILCRIIQGKPLRNRWSLFGRSKTPPKWAIVHIDEVVERADQIVIRGKAKNLKSS